jgi:error-prone DNA polymerase
VGRFLNESSAVPDIDIDIDTRRREEVIRYVYEKYGEEHAAMVCTYVTFRARNAIREVGKVLGFPPHILDRMAKSVSACSPASAIEDLKDIPEFRHCLDSAAWGHFCAMSRQIADFPRHLSIHVGGMIISSKSISEMAPLERARAEGRVVCQWDKDGVDDAGLIKVDLLGLRMLSLIDEAVRLVRKTRGIALDLDRLSEDDPLVYDLIGRADTVGVFQVESRAQMQSLPRVKPRSLEDLGIEAAIIRPGPLQGNMVHPYMRRRNGEERVVYLHPLLEPILRQTLGVVLFQEQVLQVAMAVAGFTASVANGLRKAMGRKKGREEMERWRDAFLQGAAGKGVERARAMKIFDLICGFAEFGFCKSHAMSFALLCYRSAFLKLYCPSEFYCALLNNQPMGFYIPEVIVGDARRHGVKVFPVDVNKSLWPCTPEENGVRLGFRYVKSLGEERADGVAAERERGEFRSFKEFCFRVRLDKDALRSLIIIGAFDRLERSRRQLLWALRSIDAAHLRGMELEMPERAPLDEMTGREELLAAYSIQGFSASSHLLALFRDRLSRVGAVKSSQLSRCASGRMVAIGGYNICLQMPPTAKGFAFITLEDEEGLVNVVLKPNVYRTHRQLVRLKPLLIIEGVVEREDGVVNVMAQKIRCMES